MKALTIDTTVRTVGSPALLLGLVDLNVSDFQGINIKALDLHIIISGWNNNFSGTKHEANLSVTLSILQQIEHELAGLCRPSALSGASHFGLSRPANTTAKLAEGNGLLVLQNIIKILLGLSAAHAFNCLCHLMRVLEMYAKVRATGLAGCNRITSRQPFKLILESSC